MRFKGELKHTENDLTKTPVSKVFLVNTNGLAVLASRQQVDGCGVSFNSLGQGPGLTPGLTWHDHLETEHRSVLPGPHPCSFLHLFQSPGTVMLGRPDGCRRGRCLCWLYRVVSDGGVHTESCSIAWEGPESLLPVKKGSLDVLCILTSISAHPSSFSPLVVKFLTVSNVLLELIFCCW